MSKLTDDLRACDPIASPNVAGILMDTAAGRIEELERNIPAEVLVLPPGPFILRVQENVSMELVESLIREFERLGRTDATVLVLGTADIKETTP